MVNSLFVNLPIANLKNSVEFFTGLGFAFNPQFTDEQSTCMIVNDNIFIMLLEHAKFESFIEKKIAPKDTAEAIFGLSCDSAEDVRTLCEKAFSLGARKVNEPEDIGFMFSWGFEDLDGHLWDVFWMNPEHILD
ncbi:VOC family protein [Aurantimicrobium minutum]|uniref:VOC family protein n=1 Tax=Aurantimicrobium minutum TaxID=708131 RepID=UPI00247330A0|nr:VOC family protein [Aurantimicrobium minutum]MDH6238881.1 putative lactoylglutathione lyase [Aurantimicrobium minutum]